MQGHRGPGSGSSARALAPAPLVAASSFPPSFLESVLGASPGHCPAVSGGNHHGTEPQEAGSQSEHIKKETVVAGPNGVVQSAKWFSGVRDRGQVE